MAPSSWLSSHWQFKNALKTLSSFESFFTLQAAEREAFAGLNKVFQVRVTPYYAALASREDSHDPIRKILMPRVEELHSGLQQMQDPLGENAHRPEARIIHRYPDRCLFLVTDFCSVYCRYCTRKHFTGKNQSFVNNSDYKSALKYIGQNPAIKEVILSGGDPLTLSDEKLEQVLFDLRNIKHIEIIRVGSRMPVVAPMRVTQELAKMLRKYKPVFFMTHFNHPKEITKESAESVEMLVDHGVPVMNQMVLLNGINNHEAIVQALSRRLLYLRAKPYYMFQCDPSMGTDHLRTSVEDSLKIQKNLWGRLSGLAMPTLSLDIPGGGGKVSLSPEFLLNQTSGERTFKGWDGVINSYKDPEAEKIVKPSDTEDYMQEWLQIKNARYGKDVLKNNFEAK